MKRTSIICALLSLTLGSFAAKTETLTSPGGNIKMTVTVDKQLTLSVFRGDEQILKDCPLGLQVGQEQFVQNPKLSSSKRSKVDEVIRPVVPLKQAEVKNKANQLTMTFKGGISIDFRAYDNGVAYRFSISKGKGQTDVVSESLELNLPASFTAHISKTRGFGTSYENPYTHVSTADLKADDHYVVAKRKGTKWFIGAITGDKQQDLDISLDFLSKSGHMTAFQDGRNAHRIAVDYKRTEQNVTPQTRLHLHLVRNGGWCAVVE